MKRILLLSLITVFSTLNSWGQADPGSSGMSFDKSKFYLNETGVLYVTIGNYSGYLNTGKALLPYDATFTITIPSDLKVNGTINLAGLPFTALVANHTTSYNGSTIIVIAVPFGILRGTYGTLSIPVLAYRENPDILYASVKTDTNLNTPSSGNAIPNNDLVHAPVSVCAPLPVTLKSFGASAENKLAHIAWETTEEINSDRFDIEHSVDGKKWNLLGSIPSHQNSTQHHAYGFRHENPANGNNYYRLKLWDLDGTSAYSTIRNVEFLMPELQIYPNPVADLLTIQPQEGSPLESVQLIDKKGKIIQELKGQNLWEMDVRNVPEGMYSVRVQQFGQTSVKKVLIAH